MVQRVVTGNPLVWHHAYFLLPLPPPRMGRRGGGRAPRGDAGEVRPPRAVRGQRDGAPAAGEDGRDKIRSVLKQKHVLDVPTDGPTDQPTDQSGKTNFCQTKVISVWFQQQ